MRLSSNGRTLQYEIAGNGPDVMILIPALGATAEMWKLQVQYFSSNYRVVTYDPLAASGTPATNLAEFAADLLGLADHAGSRRPHLVGLSMGGMIAQEFAIRYGDRVASLVLADTTSQYPHAQRRQFEERADAAKVHGMVELAAAAMERWFTLDFRQNHPGTVAWVQEMFESVPPRTYAAAARAVGAVDTTQRLPQIAAPVLVLAGSEDATLPPGSVDVLCARIPHCRRSTVTGAAHLPNIQCPDDFNRQVDDFLRSLVDAPPGSE